MVSSKLKVFRWQSPKKRLGLWPSQQRPQGCEKRLWWNWGSLGLPFFHKHLVALLVYHKVTYTVGSSTIWNSGRLAKAKKRSRRVHPLLIFLLVCLVGSHFSTAFYSDAPMGLELKKLAEEGGQSLLGKFLKFLQPCVLFFKLKQSLEVIFCKSCATSRVLTSL